MAIASSTSATLIWIVCRSWFPLITATRNHPGRLLSEPLGRLHFWCTIIGAYAVFLPMHLTGLAGEPGQAARDRRS